MDRPFFDWAIAAVLFALTLTLAHIVWTGVTADIAAQIAAEAGNTGKWGATK